MSPFGNSTTASRGISSVPKRVDSRVRVCVVMVRAASLTAQEIEERRLDDGSAGPQRGLVGVLLVGEIEDGLGHVRVLDVGEQRGRGVLDAAQTCLGRVEPAH